MANGTTVSFSIRGPGGHFYYDVNKAGKVKFRSTDANRLGSEKTDGINWGDANAKSIDLLTQKFVDAAVGN